MSMLVRSPRTYLPDDLVRMTDGKSYELVDGRLEPLNVSGLSSLACVSLIRSFIDYCEPNRLAYVFGSNYGYVCFAEKNRLRRPDVSVVLATRLTAKQLEAGYAVIPPDLAVEVLSPKDLAYKVNEKVQDYLDAGVRLVWVVDPVRRHVHVYQADGSGFLVREPGDLDGGDVLPGFQCRAADIFAQTAISPAHSEAEESGPK